ncbi:MAG: PIN domain-containing protein [Ignavibacteriae bacterium]|nr:PIN domain-containing protein [Ignavibacteriota bacterium]
MQLVLDTNILLAALIRNSKTRNLLLHPSFSFFLPEYSLEEIKEHRRTIVDKSKLSETEIDFLLDLLLSNLTIVPESSFHSYINRAKEIMSLIDPDDFPFVALALSFHNDGIWSQDKDLHRQSIVKIWTTAELLNLLSEGKIR